jgi:Tol biopolymer transport system component
LTGAGFWYARKGSDNQKSSPILSAAFKSEYISTNGRVLNAVISPDGKNVAYTNGLGDDKQSLWLKQLDSSTNTEIIPPLGEFYYDLAFSHDGNSLYFVRGEVPGTSNNQYSIYRISIFGGIARKVVDEVQGGISVSADGERISFVRCDLRSDDWCSLWIANAADGKNERKLVSRPSPLRIGDNKISPDGRRIAFGSGQSRNGANAFGLSVVDIATGVETELTAEKFFVIRSLTWLPNGNDLLITALKYPDNQCRIWQVSAITGEAVVKTRGSEDYFGIRLDDAASIAVATILRPEFHLNLYTADNSRKTAGVFADAATVAFTSEGKLLASAGRSGNIDLWSINIDGGEQRQLTNTPLDDRDAMALGAGNSIYFASNRSGQTHVWQMKADGSDQKQITSIEGGIPLGISPDKKWLYYHSPLSKTLRRVSLSNGREELIVDKIKHGYAVSPDGSHAAFIENLGGAPMLMVITLPDGQTAGTYMLGDNKTRASGMAWSADGNGLYYVTDAGPGEAGSTVWSQPLNTTQAVKIVDIPGEELRNNNSFAVSPDGKSFAVIQGTWKRDAILLRGLE